MSDYPKIVVRPPGPKARELVKRDEQVISQSFVRFYPLVIEGGKGCILRDVDGNEYIDFNSGLVCLNVGHNHPKVVEAIKKQCDRYLHYSITDFLYREVVDLGEKLCEITPGKWEKKVFFGNSGAESITAQLSLLVGILGDNCSSLSSAPFTVELLVRFLSLPASLFSVGISFRWFQALRMCPIHIVTVVPSS